MIPYLKSFKFSALLFFCCCIFYLVLAYDLERTDFLKLISLYAGLFLMSYLFFKSQQNNPKLLLAAAAIFRLIFLIAIPSLSQDFYRFIWDGRLLLEGISPYLCTPEELISANGPFPGATELYHGMGSLSAGNPTSYPPLAQLFFGLAVYLGGQSILGSMIWLRVLIISADIGIFYFGKKILSSLRIPESNIFLYLLNPLIIIELTGNLHFEGIMLLFLLIMIYFLSREKWLYSSFFAACSIAVKLLPLMFLPLLFTRLLKRRGFHFYVYIGLFLLLFFLPILPEGHSRNFFESVSLWFQKFEFNASVYYLVRWIGYFTEGYNIIGYAGPALAIVVFLSIIALSFLRLNTHTSGLLFCMMLSMMIYFMMATTVHPWYLATPLLLSVFTRYYFVQVWSFMVVLSYFTYTRQDYEEDLWFIALEYAVVIGVMIFELVKKSPQTTGESLK